MPMPAHESCGSSWVLPRSSFRFPMGSLVYHVVRGEFDLAQRLDEDLLRLSRQRNNSAGLVLGHTSSGRTLMFAGRFASSRSHLEEALALYDPISHRSLVHQAGIHPHVIITGDIWGLSFSVSAFRTRHWHGAARQSLRLGGWLIRRLWLRAWRLGARLLSLVGDDAALDERADQLVAVATEQGFPYWRAHGNDLSRLGQGQKWRCGGGDIASAQRFDRLPRHRGGSVDALFYRPPGQGM